jgi:hypothetical protein
MTRPRLAAGVLSAIMFSIAACGGSGSATPTAGTSTTAAAASEPAASVPAPGGSGGTSGSLDASTLVTADMAASIIGGTPTNAGGPGVGTQAMSVAVYRNAAGDTVTVLVEQVPGGIANAELQAAISAAGAQGSLQAVSGLGDAAGKVVTASEATVAFVKGSNLVVISAMATTMAGSDLEPKVESVARQVAGSL